MKKLLLLFLVALLILTGVVGFRTMTFTSPQIEVERVTDIEVPEEEVAQRLASAITFRTISHQDPMLFDSTAFLGLHQYLEEQFPGVHATLRREVVSGYSLLFTWRGTEGAAQPFLLMGHMDVVPVEAGTEDDWTHDPFGGDIADGYIWGRGALDDKSGVLSVLEAVELLIAQGFRPRQTVYLAFGHDEEVSGVAGATKIAELLESRGVDLEFVLDEGGAVMEAGLMAGLQEMAAVIGIAEKGYLSVELGVETTGGHSSVPPPQSAVGILSTAIHRLERNHPGATLAGPTGMMFEHLGPRMGLVSRAFLANRWLSEWLLKRRLAATPELDAMMRTTTAATIFQAGEKENALPINARAVVNFRIVPGDSISGILDHVRSTIDDDERVTVRQIGPASEPSPVSSIESPAFRTLQETIRQIMPGTVVSPYLVIGGTDSRHYQGIADNVYRFSATRVGEGDLKRAHGTDERIGIENYAGTVKFLVQFIRRAGT
jgi:carboxypeptidase PM20D1